MITLKLYNGELRQVEKGSTLLPLAQEFAKDFETPIVEGVFMVKLSIYKLLCKKMVL